MQTISATDLARRTREVLNKVATQRTSIRIERNEVPIARISPESASMTILEALADLGGVGFTPEEADAWLKDSRGDFDETVLDPWA